MIFIRLAVDTVASPSPFYAIATGVAVLVTALTGYFTYRATDRARRAEAATGISTRTAELVKAESDGWKALIETLTQRYDESQEEVVRLATALRSSHGEAIELQEQWRALQAESAARISDLEHELEVAHTRHKAAIRELEIEVDRYRREVGTLKQEVVDLRALVPSGQLRRKNDRS